MSEPKENVCLGDTLGTESCRSLVLASIRRAATGYGLRLHREDLEDIAQETMLLLWDRAAAAQPTYPGGYLRRAARNTLLDFLRRRRAAKRGDVETVGLAEVTARCSDDTGAEERLLRREQASQLVAAFRQILSAETVRVIFLVYGLGLSSREAAVVLGVSVSAIDTAVHRARRRLAESSGIVLCHRRSRSGNGSREFEVRQC